MTDDELESLMLSAGDAIASHQEDAEVVVSDVLILVSYSDNDGTMALCWNRLDSTPPWVTLGMAHAYLEAQAAEQAATKTARLVGDD